MIVAWFVGDLHGPRAGRAARFLASFVRCIDPRHRRTSGSPRIRIRRFTRRRPGYPVDVEIAGPVKQSRLTIFFRGILVIPAYIVFYVLSQVAQLVSIACWFYALFTGRQHKGMQELLCVLPPLPGADLRLLFLLTQRYPSFSDD